MCLAPPHKPNAQIDASAAAAGWKTQVGDRRRWRHLLFPGGKERWGQLREWGQSHLVGVEQTVALVKTWVMKRFETI